MQRTLETTKTISQEELKSLASQTGPCVTIYFPTQPGENTARQDLTRLRECVRQAEERLLSRGLDTASVQELLKPVRELTGDEWDVARGSFVVLRSPDTLRFFQIPVERTESVCVGDHFHLLPVLPAILKQQQEFYILALSQKHVRLLRCTQSGSEEVPLQAAMPKSLEEWLNTRMPNASPEHGATREANAGPAGEFTSTTDQDNKDQHLANFFRNVNKYLAEMLQKDHRPLVLAAVEYEQSMYRDLNTYAHLADTGVTGSPDGLKGGELHKRALEAVRPYFDQPYKRALGIWEKLGGTDRVSTDIKGIAKAAFEARVAHLFAAEGARIKGRFDAATLTFHAGEESPDDLVNTIAMQTIACGGDVFICDEKGVPGDKPVAAVFRY